MTDAELLRRILEVVRRDNRDAIRHVYVSKNGKPYMFDDYGKLIGEYDGSIPCHSAMPEELEKQVIEAGF